MILEDSFYDMAPVKRGRRGVSDADDEDDDYRRKRDRNNELCLAIVKQEMRVNGLTVEDVKFRAKLSRLSGKADPEARINNCQAELMSFNKNPAVKKSRFKSKQRTQETFTRVSKLKAENQMLEEKVKTLSKELQFLRELFLAHASNSQNPKFDGIDLEKLLEDVPDDSKDKKDSK